MKAKFMLFVLVLVLLFSWCPVALATDDVGYLETQVLFETADGAYPRLPGILYTQDGSIIATAQWRKDGLGDLGNPTDIIMRRSTDNGATWSSVQTLVDGGDDITTSIGPVIQDSTTGRIFITYFNIPVSYTSESGFFNIFANDWTPFYLKYSDDDGITWSNPVSISVISDSNGNYALPSNASHGIQLSSGRLIIPAWVVPASGDDFLTQRAGIIYSDDHGVTWNVGAVAPENSNESCVAADSDGDLYLSWRTVNPSISNNTRGWSRSSDGGLSFSSSGYQSELVNSTVHAGIVKYPTTDGNDQIMIFSNPVGPSRTNMTIRVSDDDGYTWSDGVRINTVYAGYSDLAIIDDGGVGCIYESDSLNTISFCRVGYDYINFDGETSFYDCSILLTQADSPWTLIEGDSNNAVTDNGILEINQITAGRLYWTHDVECDTNYRGITAEFKARVLSNSTVPVELSVHTQNGCAYSINVFKDKLTYWNGVTTDTVLMENIDNYTDFHTYTLAINPGDTINDQTVSIYRDGELISVQNACTISTLSNVIKLGKAWGTAQLTAQIDYVRYTNTGSYAPSLQYSGTELPSSENTIWTFTGTNDATELNSASVNNGVLLLSQSSGRAYWTAPVDYDEEQIGCTAKMRVKVSSSSTAPIEITVRSGEQAIYAVNIFNNQVTYWNGTADEVILSNVDNYSDYHVYTLIVDPSTTASARTVNIYRDGVLLATKTPTATTGTAVIKWGKGWAGGALSANVDYVSFYALTTSS